MTERAGRNHIASMDSTAEERPNPKPRRKSLAAAYVLLGIFGPIGGHRFYLGRWRSGAALLFLSLVSSFFLLLGIGAEETMTGLDAVEAEQLATLARGLFLLAFAFHLPPLVVSIADVFALPRMVGGGAEGAS